MAKKKTKENVLDLDQILFNCRNYLRAARNSGSFFEKRDMMLTLVFLRFIGEKYEDGVQKLRRYLAGEGLDPDEENIRKAFFDDPTFTDGTYYLPPEARWETIISTPAPKLNVALDTALRLLEEADPQLSGCSSSRGRSPQGASRPSTSRGLSTRWARSATSTSARRRT